MQRAPDDADLLSRARERDLDAFSELIRRYEHRVRVVLRRLLDDDRDIEEATQDVFVQVWRGLARFRGESAVFTWLYRIAVNEALMRRRRRRLPVVELDEAAERHVPPDSDVSEPEAAAGAAEVREFLLARLRALPFEYRVPIVLRDVEGLSNEEVADVLGLSVPAAKSRIHRARLRIRAELEAWERGR